MIDDSIWPEKGKWPKKLTNQLLNYLHDKVVFRSDGDAWVIGNLIDEIKKQRGLCDYIGCFEPSTDDFTHHRYCKVHFDEAMADYERHFENRV